MGMRREDVEAAHAKLLARMREELVRRNIGEIRRLGVRLHRLRAYYRRRFPKVGAA